MCISDRSEVYSTIRNYFRDFKLFDSSIAESLKNVLEETEASSITKLDMNNLRARYESILIPNYLTTTKEIKNFRQTIEVLFKASYVLMHSTDPRAKDHMYADESELLKEYPEFKDLSMKELSQLLKFRNFMSVALLLIPSKNNKQLLIKICGRLEGTCKTYVTGSGQTEAVNHRVTIYEKEGRRQSLKRSAPQVNEYEHCAKVPRHCDSLSHDQDEINGIKSGLIDHYVADALNDFLLDISDFDALDGLIMSREMMDLLSDPRFDISFDESLCLDYSQTHNASQPNCEWGDWQTWAMKASESRGFGFKEVSRHLHSVPGHEDRSPDPPPIISFTQRSKWVDTGQILTLQAYLCTIMHRRRLFSCSLRC